MSQRGVWLQRVRRQTLERMAFRSKSLGKAEAGLRANAY
jgi:hypothetical protein